MKTKVTAVLMLVLLLAARAAAQTPEGARGQGQGIAPSAARAELIRLEAQASVELDLTRAVKLHKRILPLRETIYGTESYEAALTHVQLGHLAEVMGGQDEAERRFRRFIEIAEKTKGGAEDNLAVVYTRLACLLQRKGEEAGAAAAAARSDEIFKSVAEQHAPLDGGALDAKSIYKPPPSYPDAANRVRAQGTVTVEVIVSETGTVVSACAHEGDTDPSLKRASELAAYHTRFSRAYVNGKPVKVRGTLTYNYVLR
jgi:TonB family protein